MEQCCTLPEKGWPLALLFVAQFFLYSTRKAQTSCSSTNLTNLLLMNLCQQIFIFTCTISLRKADSPAERNHPSRKIALKNQAWETWDKKANQMNADNKIGNWRTVYAAISPKFPRSFSVCLHEWLMAQRQLLLLTGAGISSGLVGHQPASLHVEMEMAACSLWRWPHTLAAFSSVAF